MVLFSVKNFNNDPILFQIPPPGRFKRNGSQPCLRGSESSFKRQLSTPVCMSAYHTLDTRHHWWYIGGVLCTCHDDTSYLLWYCYDTALWEIKSDNVWIWFIVTSTQINANDTLMQDFWFFNNVIDAILWNFFPWALF